MLKGCVQHSFSVSIGADKGHSFTECRKFHTLTCGGNIGRNIEGCSSLFLWRVEVYVPCAEAEYSKKALDQRAETRTYP